MKLNIDYNFPDDYNIDINEFDKQLEFQQLMLKKQYEERIKVKKERDKERELSPDVIVEENELKKIEEKTKENKNYYLIDKFIWSYQAEIIDNDTLGRCALHYILGSLLRHKRIYRSEYKWIDWRIHLILIQMSGTGKGETANYIDRIIKRIGFPMKNNFTNTLLPRNQWRKITTITSGVSTPESLVNTYVYEKGVPKKDENGELIINMGSLQYYDFFIYEEGGHLFNGSQKSLDMTDSFLRAMEPIGSSNNKIDKKLTQYASALPTTSESSLFFMTRPMGKLKKEVAASGLFQRCLFIPRELNYKIVNDMRKGSADNDLLYMGNVKNKKVNEFYEDMIEEIFKVIEFSYDKEFCLSQHNLDKIRKFVNDKLDWFYDNMISDVPSDDLKYILSSLQNRYKDNMITLAYHSAAMRYSNIVDLEDFQYAFELIKELYEEQKRWLSLSLEMDYREIKEKQDYKRIIINSVKSDKLGIKTIKDVALDLCKTFELEYKVALEKVKSMTVGKYAIFTLKGEGETAKIKLI